MEIKFKRDTAFRKQFFMPDSFAHPAKMDAQLLIWIVEHYTKVSDVILDPMAGSGTLMLACGLGRDCILVDLEEKFCKMMRDNWERVRQMPQLGHGMGKCEIIQGDARDLNNLLVDKIITSPPYTNRMDGGMRGPRAGMIPYTDERPDSWYTQRDQNNIGNLPYGNIDAVITSPPYQNEPTISAKYLQIRSEIGRDISKPSQKYAKYADAVITSPPYENAVHKGSGEWSQSTQGKMVGVPQGEDYTKSNNNIGNLKGETYLQAMLQVYQQCHKVLKPEGLMILVTKNFIRNKQIVGLDLDTIKLCEQAGFSFLERYYRKLPSQSFWRVIYHQKYPQVEMIHFEDVLVFKKQGAL